MTLLAAPNTQNEETSNNPHRGCGPACVASVVTDSGTARTTSQIDDEMGVGTGTTTGEQLVAELNRYNLNATIVRGSLPAIAQAANGQGHEIILLHQCDGYARPVPAGSTSDAHWRVGWGYDAINYATMNPWGGINESVPCRALEAAYLGECVVIATVLPKDGGAVMTDDDRKWVETRIAYATIAGMYLGLMGVVPAGKTLDYVVGQSGVEQGNGNAVNALVNHANAVQEIGQAMQKIRAVTNPEAYPANQG